MKTIEFLTQLATSAHHKMSIALLPQSLPSEVQNAFAANDAATLKKYLNPSDTILADRTTVFKY